MPQDGCAISSTNGSSPTAKSIHDQLSMFDLPTLPDSTNAISSQASADGRSPCEERDGLTLDLFGQEAAPAGRSRSSASRLDMQTHGTFGRLGLSSSASDDLHRSLANNLRLLLAGSDLCEVIWRRWVTPWGRCLSRPHARVRSSCATDTGSWAFWSTASSRDWKDTPGMSIKRERNRKRLDQLPRQVFNSEAISSISRTVASTEKCGALNPDFVSCLMGFPPEWISCAPSAMPSIRDLPAPSFARPCNASGADTDGCEWPSARSNDRERADKVSRETRE